MKGLRFRPFVLTAPAVLLLSTACSYYVVRSAPATPNIDSTQLELEFTAFTDAGSLALAFSKEVFALTGADGEPQLVVAVPFHEGRGRLLLFDTESGDVRSEFRPETSGARYGRSLALLDAGDGRGPGLLVGAPGIGAVELLSPGDWTASYRATERTQNEYFGEALCVVDDVNGDGVRDFCVGAPRAGRGTGAVYLVSGADGGILDRVAAAGDQWSLGSSLTSLTVDGSAYVFAGAPRGSSGRRAHQGTVHAFLAADGELHEVWVLKGPRDYENAGYSLCSMDAFVIGGVATPSVVVGNQPMDSQPPCLRVVDALTGVILAEYVGHTGTGLGFAASRCPDYDGDGFHDVIVGSPSLVRAPTDPGRKGAVRILYSSGGMSEAFVFAGRRNCGVAVGVVSGLEGEEARTLFVACQGDSLPGGLESSILLFSVP